MTDLIIYGAIILVVLATMIYTLYRTIHLKKVKQSQPVLDEATKERILIALGGISNIIKTGIEHQRLHIEVKDTKKLDPTAFNQLEIPAFLTGKTIKLLIKNQPMAVIDYISNQRNEE